MTVTADAAPGQQPRFFYGWALVGACMSIHFYFCVAFVYGFQAFLNPMVAELNWTQAETLAAFSLQRLQNGVVSPLIGFWVDRLGSQKMVMGGMTFMGAGLMLGSQV